MSPVMNLIGAFTAIFEAVLRGANAPIWFGIVDAHRWRTLLKALGRRIHAALLEDLAAQKRDLRALRTGGARCSAQA